MKYLSLGILSSLLLCSSADAFDIADAIDSALENNTQLKAGKINLEKSHLNRFRAAESFLPSISAQSTMSEQYAGGDRQIPGTTPKNQSLNIQQSIFSGGRGIYALKISKFSDEIEAMKYQLTLDQTIIDVVQRYESVIAYRNIYKSAVQDESRLKEIVKQAEVKLSVGAITNTDMLEAKAGLANATSKKEKAFADMKNSEGEFAYVVGKEAPIDLNDIDVSAIQSLKSYNDFINDVLHNNYNIKIADKTLSAKKLSVRSAKAALLPSVTASASLQNSDIFTNSPFAPTTRVNNQTGQNYQLQISLPIFSSGEEYINIKDSLYDEDAARNNKADVGLQIKKSAAKSWNDYKQTESSVKAMEISVRFYDSFVTGIEEEFHIGTKTLTDVLKAQQEYESAKINLIQTKANFVISALNLKYFTSEIGSVDFSKLKTKKIDETKKGPAVGKIVAVKNTVEEKKTNINNIDKEKDNAPKQQ